MARISSSKLQVKGQTVLEAGSVVMSRHQARPSLQSEACLKHLEAGLIGALGKGVLWKHPELSCHLNLAPFSPPVLPTLEEVVLSDC